MSATNFQIIERLIDQLSTEEQISMIEQLARRLHKTVRPAPPKNLYGIWHDRFPTDFDIDSALKQIRTSWEKEWTPNPRT